MHHGYRPDILDLGVRLDSGSARRSDGQALWEWVDAQPWSLSPACLGRPGIKNIMLVFVDCEQGQFLPKPWAMMLPVAPWSHV